MFIDTHAHLFYENFDDDVDEVIQRAIDAGVEYMIIPGTDLPTSRQALELARKYDNIFATAGIHPHDSAKLEKGWEKELEKLLDEPKVVAVGEIGLDYYYDFSPAETQIEVFRKQLDIAVARNLPVVIHNRDSSEDLMKIIREYKDTRLKAQFHCFAGDEQEARELISYGHLISFTGNITFKSRDKLREIVSSIDVENLMLETDSPFMTPVPHRGKRNEPAHVALVAKQLSEIYHLSVEDIARTTSYNVFRLFGIGSNPELKKTYKIRNSLYVNVTNRCNADCVFCDRKGEANIKGYNLKMSKKEEPSAQEYISEIKDPTQYDEIVFCGYGEPTIRWEVVKEVAQWVKENGGKTRMNTNGHGNVINKRDITPDLENLLDTVSVSLNSVSPKQYSELMQLPEHYHQDMIDFAKSASKYTNVVMSIVGMDNIDTEKAKKFVSEDLGLEFRERVYF